jgi:hypothetical protein
VKSRRGEDGVPVWSNRSGQMTNARALANMKTVGTSSTSMSGVI